MMRWITTLAAWEAKALALEYAHACWEVGRVCLEVNCLAQSEIGFDLKTGWEVGLCAAHAAGFAADCADLIEGSPSRLEDDDVLHGPLSAPVDPDPS